MSLRTAGKRSRPTKAKPPPPVRNGVLPCLGADECWGSAGPTPVPCHAENYFRPLSCRGGRPRVGAQQLGISDTTWRVPPSQRRRCARSASRRACTRSRPRCFSKKMNGFPNTDTMRSRRTLSGECPHACSALLRSSSWELTEVSPVLGSTVLVSGQGRR
jgi:hypothetical protein